MPCWYAAPFHHASDILLADQALIGLLTRATKRMASGDYWLRARKVSGDELGQLTSDFNQMANALEDNIGKLEEEISRQGRTLWLHLPTN